MEILINFYLVTQILTISKLVVHIVVLLDLLLDVKDVRECVLTQQSVRQFTQHADVQLHVRFVDKNYFAPPIMYCHILHVVWIVVHFVMLVDLLFDVKEEFNWDYCITILVYSFTLAIKIRKVQ